jgi:hypothetical protein
MAAKQGPRALLCVCTPHSIDCVQSSGSWSAPCLGLGAPGVDDWAAALADGVAEPVPGVRVDGLAHRAQHPQAAAVVVEDLAIQTLRAMHSLRLQTESRTPLFDTPLSQSRASQGFPAEQGTACPSHLACVRTDRQTRFLLFAFCLLACSPAAARATQGG